jgi:hypothetical protein
MTRLSRSRRVHLLKWLGAAALTLSAAAGAGAAAPKADEAELLNLGFKVLVATTEVQQDWVRSMPPGKIRPMQRTGKKYFIYPDAPKNQIYVGGPQEYAAYVKLRPQDKISTHEDAKRASEYRAKQDDVMRKATAHDLSDPFLGVTWADLGW